VTIEAIGTTVTRYKKLGIAKTDQNIFIKSSH